MADVQSDNGWTKTELGDGWVKLTEVCDVFGTGGTDSLFTTPITNTTANAVTDGPTMPIINELKAAGEFMVEVTLGAGTIDANTTIHALNSAGTYQVISGLLTEAQSASTTSLASYTGAITNGIKVVIDKDSGTAANTCTVSLIYYSGGPNQSDVTIAGVGADPS
tara:strand:+ start:40 stop:534 length:495 start_codon:yes stop_codon:yes gene_type:complete